jgi:hypothetical protein
LKYFNPNQTKENRLTNRIIQHSKGSKSRVKMTGSYKKIFLFGSLSLGGKQLFQQYDEMNGKTFLRYLKCEKRKYEKFIFFYDGAP